MGIHIVFFHFGCSLRMKVTKHRNTFKTSYFFVHYLICSKNDIINQHIHYSIRNSVAFSGGGSVPDSSDGVEPHRVEP